MLDDIMRIAICDDDPEDRRLVEEMTRQAAGQEGIPCEVVCFDSGKALLQALYSRLGPFDVDEQKTQITFRAPKVFGCISLCGN